MTIAQFETLLGVPLWWLLVPAVLVLAGLRRDQPGRRRPRVRRLAAVVPFPASSGHAPGFDAAEQLRIVERAEFKRRPLLNRGEARLLQVLEEACAAEAPDWRVMAQVSLGEILASPDEAAYRAINSKRVDLLLVGPDRHARHAIEFQGSGHHLGPAATRDAIKKEALRKAGIGYVEVRPGDTPGNIRALVASLARRERDEAAA